MHYLQCSKYLRAKKCPDLAHYAVQTVAVYKTHVLVTSSVSLSHGSSQLWGSVHTIHWVPGQVVKCVP